MRRLEELIRQFCPDGVEYQKVEKISRTLAPRAKIKSHSYLENGKYPVINQGQDYIGGYTDEEGAFPQGEYVIFGDHTCVVKFVDFPFVQGADGVKVIVPKEAIICKYLYYCMSNIKINVSYARHWSKMRDEEIPVPPLEVQQEIVRILDQFTELTAELTARKKQYEYYQKYLLKFDNDVKWAPLGEIANVTDYVANGSFASLRENVSYKNEPDFAVLIRTADYSTNFNPQKMVYIDEHAYEFLSKSKLFGGEIIINNVGAGVGTTFRCPNLNMPMSLAPNSVVVSTNDDAFYYYWFISQWGQDAIRKIVSKSAMPKFNKTGLRSIKVPVPTKEVRERVVDILDRFDALCNDLTSGLPAEIEARRKQYEYYRDKLLTFKRLEA